MHEPIFTRQMTVRLAIVTTLLGAAILAMPSPSASTNNYPSFKPVTAMGVGLLAIGSGGNPFSK